MRRTETTLSWQKSSYSGTSGCLEVAEVQAFVLVRDSKDEYGPRLNFMRSDWTKFIAGLKDDAFRQ